MYNLNLNIVLNLESFNLADENFTRKFITNLKLYIFDLHEVSQQVNGTNKLITHQIGSSKVVQQIIIVPG